MSPLSIERKAVIVFLLVFFGIAVAVALQYRATSNYRSMGILRALVSDIHSNMLTLRRNEKDFLVRKDLKYSQIFLNNYDLIRANVQKLISGLHENEIEDAKTDLLVETLNAYKNKFLAMAELQKDIGFDHQDGLYGRLRDAIHRVEDILAMQSHDQLSKDMLMLRRREKDFMLRNDIEYKEKFDRDLVAMQSNISKARIDKELKKQISAALMVYVDDFEALVSATQKMGLSSGEGLHGEMRKNIHQSEEIINELRRETLLLESRAGSHMINNLMTIAISILLLLLFHGLVRYYLAYKQEKIKGRGA